MAWRLSLFYLFCCFSCAVLFLFFSVKSNLLDHCHCHCHCFCISFSTYIIRAFYLLSHNTFRPGSIILYHDMILIFYHLDKFPGSRLEPSSNTTLVVDSLGPWSPGACPGESDQFQVQVVGPGGWVASANLGSGRTYLPRWADIYPTSFKLKLRRITKLFPRYT
jgi:hypothetical protein